MRTYPEQVSCRSALLQVEEEQILTLEVDLVGGGGGGGREGGG